MRQLAELVFTLSVLGVTPNHKVCPGVVNFSHNPITDCFIDRSFVAKRSS
jgi:hypothetical protein